MYCSSEQKHVRRGIAVFPCQLLLVNSYFENETCVERNNDFDNYACDYNLLSDWNKIIGISTVRTTDTTSLQRSSFGFCPHFRKLEPTYAWILSITILHLWLFYNPKIYSTDYYVTGCARHLSRAEQKIQVHK